MNNGHDPVNDARLNKVMVESLEQSVEHLDAYTLSRLNQARHRALARAKQPRRFAPQWVKAATFVILAITVINGWMLFSTPDDQRLNTEDLELVIADDDFELLQDLDFVAWMIEEDNAG